MKTRKLKSCSCLIHQANRCPINRATTILLFFVLFLALTSPAFAANRIAELSRRSQLPFNPPAVKPVKLSNGMICYLLEDHSIPIIQGYLLIKGGSIYADIKKTGAASITTGLLKEGGTLKNSPEKIRELLDEYAVDINFSASLESLDGSFSSLSKETDTALKLFFEMLFEPAFDKEMTVVIKKRAVDGLKREMELPGPLSHRYFREMIYGSKSPWGVVPKISLIEKISQDDIGEFYKRFVSPDKMILSAAGDFNKAEFVKKLEAFAKLYPKRDVADAIPPPVAEVDSPEEKIISKKFTQSSVNLGHLSSTRDNPDKFAIVILNDILGGSNSFSNRLADTVRVKNGLAYEIWSSYPFGPKGAPGAFQIHAKTRNQTVDKAIELIKSELGKITEDGVTKDELKKAKESILNALIFEYERPFNIAVSAAKFVYLGFPENYIEIYKKGIEKTTLEDVNAAAKKYLHPDKLKVVVVGKKR